MAATGFPIWPRKQAKSDMFDYIERFYNPVRKHSKLGYFSPLDFEQRLNGPSRPYKELGKVNLVLIWTLNIAHYTLRVYSQCKEQSTQSENLVHSHLQRRKYRSTSWNYARLFLGWSFST